jgi:hypothetical protein
MADDFDFDFFKDGPYADDYASKDPAALQGFALGLKAVDVVLQTLEESVALRAGEAERASALIAKPSAADVGDLMGTVIRLRVQRDLIKGLRKGLPEAIIDGNPSTVARLV